MAINVARLSSRISRRIPDPNFKSDYNMERHIFVVPVKDVPADLPLDPNARRPRTSKRVYQKVQDSLFNRDCEPGTFHLKNKGITIVAKSVSQIDNETYDIEMVSGVHGIVDGGHTHKIIVDAQADPTLPADQFVNVEVRVGVPDSWITDIAGGLNTSVQVQDMSLDNLAGLFEWLKSELKGEKFFPTIAWSENDPGEFDARDIVSLLTLFNVELFPKNSEEHPVFAYEKKSQALKVFESNIGSFQRMIPIIKEVLLFHDIVRRDYREIYNKGVPGGQAGKLAFSEVKQSGSWEFPFSQKSSEVRMVNGALYPILAAFRWHVDINTQTGKMQWRDGFPAMLDAWKDAALPLLKATHEMSNQLGRNPQSVGKSRIHWGNLYNLVAKRDLERRAAI